MKITFSLSSSGLQVFHALYFLFPFSQAGSWPLPSCACPLDSAPPFPHSCTHTLIQSHTFSFPLTHSYTLHLGLGRRRVHVSTPARNALSRSFVEVALNVSWWGRVVYGRPTNSPLASTHSTHIHTHIHPRTFISCGPHTATPVAGTPG